nr:NTP transferase domain-containing protein [Robbsia betulipollinis]
MSGFGERFRRAGYSVPKPLIPIDGKPIIAHVIDMFPGEQDFIFICNRDHLDNPDYGMREILQRYCPSGRIVGIAPHKLGPVHAVRQVLDLVDPQQPTVVNYCDFTCFWDWQDFKDFVAATGCAGAIPAYKGFHPHSLGSTNYAYLRETGGWVDDIQEKQPYTNDRMNEFASSGTYYFASGRIMADAFQATMAQQLNVAGEYYVSLSYKPMLAVNLPVAVYPLQHFMQWGTPDDVAEFTGWSLAFKRLIASEADASASNEAVVMPMAGLGQRFAQQGYTLAKPLIPVSGKPMVAQAVHDLPAAAQHAFVLRGDMAGHEDITQQLLPLYPHAVISTIPAVTEGQACTALLGVDALEERDGPLSGALTFGACDNGVLYDAAALQGLLDDPTVDVIVWGVRGHANAVRRPAMFGWIDAQDGVIRHISVKTPLDAPASDPIVIGTFTFRRAADFRRALARLIARDGRIGGEFYLDACINDAIELGLQCRLFEVDAFLSWGTPNDLRTFTYWQSCFHKWASHPYRLERDGRVAASALPELENDYAALRPERPAARKA